MPPAKPGLSVIAPSALNGHAEERARRCQGRDLGGGDTKARGSRSAKEGRHDRRGLYLAMLAMRGWLSVSLDSALAEIEPWRSRECAGV